MNSSFWFWYGIAMTTLSVILTMLLFFYAERITKSINKMKYKRAHKKKIDLGKWLWETDIVDIDTAQGYIDTNIVFRIRPNESLYILPTDELVKEIPDFFKARPEFTLSPRKNWSFNGSEDFGDFPETIRKMIPEHQQIVSECWIKALESGCPRFNSGSYGIHKYRPNRSKDEENTLILELYATDYFSLSVIHSIYEALYGKEFEINEQDDILENEIASHLISLIAHC